ncbi:hypothetical protein MJ572_14520 [Escherichia coli]|nr:hypothetical protein MJ572_14520 [Escherichia coli]
MRITALAGDKVVYSQTYYSIGGGFIVDEEHFGQQDSAPVEVPYPYSSAADLQKHCQDTGLSLSVISDDEKRAGAAQQKKSWHLTNVWEVMRGGIERGISTEGVLPGKLRVPRRAAALRRCWSAVIKPPLTRWRLLTGSTCLQFGSERRERCWRSRGDCAD